MLLPRFSIRTILVLVTFCALVFVVAGMALRGEPWAWGMTIALVSLAVTALVHAAWFGIVWMFARMTTHQEVAPASAVTVRNRPWQPQGDENVQ